MEVEQSIVEQQVGEKLAELDALDERLVDQLV
jgi:hypothetical protein